MTSYMYADFQKMLGLTPDDLSPESTERVMEHSIGLLNIYGAKIPEMSGNYGTKTVGLTSTQWSAVVHVTRLVYMDFIQDSSGSFTIQGLSVTAREYTTDPRKIALIKEIAENVVSESGDDPFEEIRLV